MVFDPAQLPLQKLLQFFRESHAPIHNLRQGSDSGNQYRAVIYTSTPAQAEKAEASGSRYRATLDAPNRGSITTEIRPAEISITADYPQQYLAKNPGCYCGQQRTGVTCAA